MRDRDRDDPALARRDRLAARGLLRPAGAPLVSGEARSVRTDPPPAGARGHDRDRRPAASRLWTRPHSPELALRRLKQAPALAGSDAAVDDAHDGRCALARPGAQVSTPR